MLSLSLGFHHATTGEERDITSPLADDIVALLDKWRTYIGGLQKNL